MSYIPRQRASREKFSVRVGRRLTPLWSEHYEEADESSVSLYQCAVSESTYGAGVFATEHIKRGTKVWNFQEAPSQVLTEEVAHRMCARIHDNDELMRGVLECATSKTCIQCRVHVYSRQHRMAIPASDLADMCITRSYCYWTTDGSDAKLLVDLRVDAGRFFNHSFFSNVGLGSMTAVRNSTFSVR
eukprot:COSAG05_NODE_1885_length_3893_cov_2.980232_2_plen_187_part_00